LLRGLIPLPAIEASHFLGSLTGFALMLLAWAVYRRVDVAWGASVALLAAGIVFSLAKGLDYEEAAVLATFLDALIPSRRYFYRRASLLAEPLRPGWLVAIGTVLAATLWLGFFSFKHVEYSHDLWWQFTLSAEAPRFLRATVGVLSLAVAVSLARLLRPARPAAIVSTIAREHPARAIVASSPRTQANLVFLGDKAMLLNERASAFIMYGVSGRTWVAMGDPLGPEAEHASLVRRFHEMCHRHGGRVAFYEVGKANLYLYLDIGLTVLKLGEEALVSLPEFTLEGGEYKHLRNITSRLERDGLRFEFLPRESVPDVLPELEEISDAWLEAKNTREKGFSLGFFDPGYLLEFPAALVRHEGRILAFANVWLGAGEELSVDLMRHRLDAPRSVMDFLFVRLMQWGREHGFSWFNLGMVPLKGLENRALVPLWHRLGAMVFRYGEHFYNFQGLRQFKEKFGPRWEPRYLAAPGGLALPRVVADIASLISRGLKGVVAK
jgi:phosphatidylglycerol lysyltransferase